MSKLDQLRAMREANWAKGGLRKTNAVGALTGKFLASVTKSVTETPAALPKVGRPRNPNKLTAAEKQRAYRERKRAAR